MERIKIIGCILFILGFLLLLGLMDFLIWTTHSPIAGLTAIFIEFMIFGIVLMTAD